LTLVEVIGWGIAAVIIGAAILMLLSDFDINITPLLASAGVGGLALSLGAQTLIKDLIGGFFVLVENQYCVGDTI
jgi:small-conductance mechanosensitive channel